MGGCSIFLTPRHSASLINDIHAIRNHMDPDVFVVAVHVGEHYEFRIFFLSSILFSVICLHFLIVLHLCIFTIIL